MFGQTATYGIELQMRRNARPDRKPPRRLLVPAAARLLLGTALKLLGRINTPTLLIGGSQDAGIPVSPHAKALAAGICGARLKVLDGAYLAIIEQAEWGR
jgi:pimeloyl-ACP methyl ester carboxylesterase